MIACARARLETNISFVVAKESLRKSLNVIHDSFFLSDYQVLNIFIAGISSGRNLLEQIRLQQQTLMKTTRCNPGGRTTNSRKFIVDRDGIDLTTYATIWSAAERNRRPKVPRRPVDEHLQLGVRRLYGQRRSGHHKQLLEHNVWSWRPTRSPPRRNTTATWNSVDRPQARRQVPVRNQRGRSPIINTISDLINSGDRIIRIEAVVSGTLNFIFNEMSRTVPMSRAIRMAQEAGYAEPDPRIDLSGTDVIRKLVILSREAGYRVEQKDVKKELFIPEKYFEGSVEDFWKRIPEVDASFEERRRKLEAEGKRWRFVAQMENGRTEVALREVDSESPFYHLAGSNNVILLTTERYKNTRCRSRLRRRSERDGGRRRRHHQHRQHHDPATA
ncbi:MAG: hypothetical protein ACLT1W_11675 [Alistipes onderdonkii]